jgi:GNAT superfamily N-acetyltransferase
MFLARIQQSHSFVGMTARPLPPAHSVRALTAADLPALHRLHDDVLRALPDPGLFRLFGGAQRFLADHLGARGQSLGVFARQELVAYGSLTRPAAGDLDNYAGDLGWAPDRSDRVALLSAAMVHPSHRGQGLHRMLIAERIRLAAALGARELLVRAAPANAVSRRTLLSHGFAVAWLGVQREGSLRHVLWRPIGGPAWMDSALDDAAFSWAAADDLAGQQRLLSEGWIGVRMRAGDEALGFVQVAGEGR